MPKSKLPFHYNAPSEHTERARKLRQPQTPAEDALWQAVRNRKRGGAKFRRQHPISWYIVDFYCHEYKLVVEVDGDVHLNPHVKERDENRQAHLEQLGLTVIRFTNEEVLGELTHVLNRIETYFAK